MVKNPNLEESWGVAKAQSIQTDLIEIWRDGSVVRRFETKGLGVNVYALPTGNFTALTRHGGALRIDVCDVPLTYGPVSLSSHEISPHIRETTATVLEIADLPGWVDYRSVEGVTLGFDMDAIEHDLLHRQDDLMRVASGARIEPTSADENPMWGSW